jgi:hypothetical protein
MEDELWFSVEIYKLTKKKKTCASYMIMIDKLNRIYSNICYLNYPVYYNPYILKNYFYY